MKKTEKIRNECGEKEKKKERRNWKKMKNDE